MSVLLFYKGNPWKSCECIGIPRISWGGSSVLFFFSFQYIVEERESRMVGKQFTTYVIFIHVNTIYARFI